MYWLIRQRQVFMNTWKVELADLKELLDLSGRYEAWDNFKRKALDKAKADCKGTWSEFDYKAVKKGKGGGVHSIIFYFKNGPKEEKDIPPGEDYAWEESLLRHGVEPIKIKEIRQRVKINQEGRNEDKNITFNWDSDYVRFSLEALGNELKEKKKDKKKKQVQNLGGFVYTGLMSGYWIDYVNSRKEKIKNEVQQNLDFVNGSARPEPLAKIENKMNGSSSIHVLQEQELLEWQELHLVSPQKDKPFEEFMNKNNYYMVDGAWVR
jgi:plasmid replication initiation protein